MPNSLCDVPSGHKKRRGRFRRTDPASHGGTLNISLLSSCCLASLAHLDTSPIRAAAKQLLH